MEIDFIRTPYKTVYEGRYGKYTFELNVFRDGNWEINWLDYCDFESQHDVEREIYKEWNTKIK